MSGKVIIESVDENPLEAVVSTNFKGKFDAEIV